MKMRKRNENEKKKIDNGVGKEEAETISESLKINTSLTYLNLGSDEKR